MVECQLPKLNVAGSSPVSRSNNPFLISALGAIFTFLVLGCDSERLHWPLGVLWGWLLRLSLG